MLVHFINMKFNGDLREETFKILFLEIVPGLKYDTVIARSCSLLGHSALIRPSLSVLAVLSCNQPLSAFFSRVTVTSQRVFRFAGSKCAR